MRRRLAFTLIPFAALAMARCVGDSSTPTDGGMDGTQGDVTVPTEGGMDVALTDADAGSPPPPPDGSIVWLNHYNNNAYPGGQAFTDLGVNESSGVIVDLSGVFLTDPSATNQFNFGTIPLGPSTGQYPVVGGLGGSDGKAVWAKVPTINGSMSFNTTSYQALTTDSAGNIYVFGYTAAASIVLKDTLPGPTAFVAKLNATGTPVWDHAYTSSNSFPQTGPVAITLSGSSVVLALTFYSDITYDTPTDGGPAASFNAQGGSSDDDVFITALDPASGATKWAGEFGSATYDNVTCIAPTPTGDVVVAGLLSGTMTGLQGAGMPVTQLGDAGTGNDLYVLKVDPTGKATYNLVYGDPASNVSAGGIAYQGGTIAVAGWVNGAVDFGTGTFTSTGADGMVFTVDESTKKTKFAVQLAGSATDVFTSVALDAWGEVIAAGQYGNSNASAQLGALPLQQTSLGTAGMVLAKWNPTGTLLWAHGYVPTLSGGGPPYSTPDAASPLLSITPSRVQTTSSGRIVVTGAMAGGTDFGLGYQGQLSTYEWPHCTCTGVKNACTILCGFMPSPCCHTQDPGWSADGIVGEWQP